MGWVTPSNVELSGRGAAPFTAATPNAYPRGSAQQGYDRIANSPVSYVPEAADDIFRMATRHITQPAINGRAAGYSAQKAPEVHDTLAQWRAYIQQRGTPITPQDLDTLRQSLRGLPDANGPAGEHAVTILDRYMVMAPPSRRASGTAQDVADMRDNFVQARGDYRGGETSRAVEERIDRAGTRQGATYSGLNENATRGEMAGLVSDQGRASRIPGATDEEATAIWQASQGTKEGNAKRAVSNMLGGGGGMHGAITMGGTGGLVAAPLIAMGVDPWTASALGFGGGFAARTYGKNLKLGNIERTVQAAEDAALSREPRGGRGARHGRDGGPAIADARSHHHGTDAGRARHRQRLGGRSLHAAGIQGRGQSAAPHREAVKHMTRTQLQDVGGYNSPRR